MTKIRWRLREELDRRGVSVYGLARRPEKQVSRTTLHEIARGKTDGVKFDKLAALMAALQQESGQAVALTDVLEVVDVPAEMDAETRAWMDGDLSRLGEYEPYGWGGEDPDTIRQPVTLGPDGRLIIDEEKR